MYMVLQHKSFVIDHTDPDQLIPGAELSLLGKNSNGEEYSYEDLYTHRDQMVAWEHSLDITPFTSSYEDIYRTALFFIEFDDIYETFKENESDSEEPNSTAIQYSYITDILLTSNDPRYDLTVDSITLVEVDENATLSHEDSCEIYPLNNIEQFFYSYSNYSELYNISVILNTSQHLPIDYYNESSDETWYFEIFDSSYESYYNGSKLNITHLTEEQGYSEAGFYNITWDPFWSMEYYYLSQAEDANLTELYECYYPFIENNTYLYIAWADTNSWAQWHTIEEENVNLDSLEIEYLYFNESIEEYESILYNSTCGMFESRSISLEYFYPHQVEGNNHKFVFSQNYSTASDLDILSIVGVYFNESFVRFNSSLAILTEGVNITITAPEGTILSDFAKIVVSLNYSSGLGIHSDYAQFRMLDNSSLWEYDDLFYLSYDSYGTKYSILMDEAQPGSEASSFTYLEYMRNEKYVYHDGVEYYIQGGVIHEEFADLAPIHDTRETLILEDTDYDGHYENVIDKKDVVGDGLYDVHRFGSVDEYTGQIYFHTSVYHTERTESNIERTSALKMTEMYEEDGYRWFDIYDWFDPYITSQKRVWEVNIINTTLRISDYIIQKDENGDGLIESDMMIESVSTSIQELHYNILYKESLKDYSQLIARFGSLSLSDLTLYERTYDLAWTILENEQARSDFYFSFSEYDKNGAPVSTRVYEDHFPNAFTEIYHPDNYMESVYNNVTSEEIEIAVLDELLGLEHDRDGVNPIFDSRVTLEGGETIYDNLLARNKTFNIPVLPCDGIGVSLTHEVIKVIPRGGKVFYNNPRQNRMLLAGVGSSSFPIEGPGSYYFLNYRNGSAETLLIVLPNGQIKGVGFDYSADGHFDIFETTIAYTHMVDFIHISHSFIAQKSLSDYSLFEMLSAVFAVSSLLNIMENVYDPNGFGVSSTSIDPHFSSVDCLFEFDKLWGKQVYHEAEILTADSFLESFGDRFVDDVIWQVGSQLIAYGGYLITEYVTDSPIVGAVAFAIIYGTLNVMHIIDQYNDATNQLKANRFYTVGKYVGPRVYSLKNWRDETFEFLPFLYGSSHQTYAPVGRHTDYSDYSGQILVSAGLVGATRNYGYLTDPYSFLYLKLMSMQADRHYEGESSKSVWEMSWGEFFDWLGDEFDQMDAFLTGRPIHLEMNPAEIIFGGIGLIWNEYSMNTIPWQESLAHSFALTSQKILGSFPNSEIFDRAIPVMFQSVPRFDFASTQAGIPLPEFYEEYPIFVSQDYYDNYRGWSIPNKMYRVTQAPTQTLSIDVNRDINHEFKLDIRSIQVKMYGLVAYSLEFLRYYFPSNVLTEALEFMDRTDDVIQAAPIVELFVTLGPNNFTFNKETGVITINEAAHQYIMELFTTKKEYYEAHFVNNPVAKLLLAKYSQSLCYEITFENFRSLEDRRGMSEEEVGHIMTMQNIQANLILYYNQFYQGVADQQRFDDLIYTIAVTSVSTAITVGITAGIKSASSAISSTLKKASKEVTEEVAEQVTKQTLKQALKALTGSGTSMTLSKFALHMTYQMVSECFQEVVIDPVIEQWASDFVKERGGDEGAQIIAGLVAESLRETGMGIFSDMFHKSDAEGMSAFESYIEQSYFEGENSESLTVDLLKQEYHEFQERQQAKSTGGSIIKALGSGLTLISAFTSLLSFNPFTALLSAGMFTAGCALDRTVSLSTPSDKKASKKELLFEYLQTQDEMLKTIVSTMEEGKVIANPQLAALHAHIESLGSQVVSTFKSTKDTRIKTIVSAIQDDACRTLAHRLLVDRESVKVRKGSMSAQDQIYRATYTKPFTQTPWYHKGEMVLFPDPNNPDGDFVAHRVDTIGIDADGSQYLQTKGDLNAEADTFLIKADDVLATLQLDEEASYMLELHKEAADQIRYVAAAGQENGIPQDDIDVEIDSSELYESLYSIIERNQHILIKCLKDLKFDDGTLIFKQWYQTARGEWIRDDEGNIVLNPNIIGITAVGKYYFILTNDGTISQNRFSEILGIKKRTWRNWRDRLSSIEANDVRKLEINIKYLEDYIRDQVSSEIDIISIMNTFNLISEYLNNLYREHYRGFNDNFLKICDEYFDYEIDLKNFRSKSHISGWNYLDDLFVKVSKFKTLNNPQYINIYINILAQVSQFDKTNVPLKGNTEIEKTENLLGFQNEIKILITKYMRNSRLIKYLRLRYVEEYGFRRDNQEFIDLIIEGMIGCTKQEGEFKEFNDFSELIAPQNPNRIIMRGYLREELKKHKPLTKDDCERIKIRIEAEYKGQTFSKELNKFLKDLEHYRKKAPEATSQRLHDEYWDQREFKIMQTYLGMHFQLFFDPYSCNFFSEGDLSKYSSKGKGVTRQHTEQDPSSIELIELTSENDFWRDDIEFKVKLIIMTMAESHKLVGHGTRASERRNIIAMCRVLHMYELLMSETILDLNKEFENKRLGDYIKRDEFGEFHPQIRYLFGENVENFQIWDTYQFNKKESLFPGILENQEIIDNYKKVLKDKKRVMRGEISERVFYERHGHLDFYENQWMKFVRDWKSYKEGEIPEILGFKVQDPLEFWEFFDEYLSTEGWYITLKYLYKLPDYYYVDE